MKLDPKTAAAVQRMAGEQRKPKNPVLKLPTESPLEAEFANLWRMLGNGQAPEREHVFAAPRKWRWDFAWPAAKLAVELDGFRDHASRKGFVKDRTKHNAGVRLGWRVLTFTTADLREKPVETMELVKRVLEGRA